MLRLSYETFVNSSLLLQGRADMFTTKKPAERKEVLAEILGLGRYEALSERAREREREDRADAEHRSARIEQLDQILAGLPAVREQLAATGSELAELQAQSASTEERVGELEKRLHTLVGLRESLGRLTERLVAIEREEDHGQRRLAEAEARARAAEELLAGEAAIRQRVSELLAARKENDRLGLLVVQLRELEARAAEARQTMAAEEAKIKSEMGAAETGLSQARAAVDGLAVLAPELEAARTRHAQVAELQERRQRCAAELEAIVGRIGETRGTIAALNARCDELREKIVILRKAGSVCPTCGGELDEQRRREAVDAAMQEGVQSKARQAAQEAVERELLSEQQRLQGVLTTVDKTIREAQQAGRRQAELEEKARSLQSLADTVPSLEG